MTRTNLKKSTLDRINVTGSQAPQEEEKNQGKHKAQELKQEVKQE